MNVLGCNDQFFNFFLNACVFGASFTMALLNNVVPGRMSLNYYICTGEDPSDYEDIKPKVSICKGTHVSPSFYQEHYYHS